MSSGPKGSKWSQDIGIDFTRISLGYDWVGIFEPRKFGDKTIEFFNLVTGKRSILKLLMKSGLPSRDYHRIKPRSSPESQLYLSHHGNQYLLLRV